MPRRWSTALTASELCCLRDASRNALRARKVRADAAVHKHVYIEHYHVYLHLHLLPQMGIPAPAARAVDPRWFKQAQRGLYAGKERLSGNHVSASKRQ